MRYNNWFCENAGLIRMVSLMLVASCLAFLPAMAQERETHVILISLDGYRYDYTERFQPENIQRLIASGTAAEGLIPVFPSKTFPNHYSLATGMRPEFHGLVDNTFLDPTSGQVYVINDRAIVQDGYWYGGTPLWVLAEQNGIKAASYFFVGTEAPVQGLQPSYYYNYDATVSNLTRVAKVFEWLALSEEERPRLVTLYFSDMDDIGHRYGPDNDEQLEKRLYKLDRELGALFEGLKSFDLDIHVILVSDHGMMNIPKSNLLDLDAIIAGIPAKVVNDGALAHVYLEDRHEEKAVFEQLRQRQDRFAVIKTGEKGHYSLNSPYSERLGDLLILPEPGYYLATPSDRVKYQNRSALFGTDTFGEHGFSPTHKDMQGIFYAVGPRIREGLRIAPFENIHVYPLVCELLGLDVPEEVEGKIEVLNPILKNGKDDEE